MEALGFGQQPQQRSQPVAIDIMKKGILKGMLSAVLILGAGYANAALQNFSFTGNFAHDNDVQLFSFTVGAASPNVILETWSYAGGVNAAGNNIARCGFDPILAVWNSAGNLIGQNDDGGPAHRSIDLSGQAWDTWLSVGGLAAGTYYATIAQYNNFANSTHLSDGFIHDGVADQTFTRGLTGHNTGQFWDVSGSQYNGRDGHWAFDILNVETAAVPEPSTYLAGALLLLPFASGSVRRLVRKS